MTRTVIMDAPALPLAIEAPPAAAPTAARSGSDDVIVLNVATSESVSLYDRLGPTVVATDGVRPLLPFVAAALIRTDSLQDRELA